jgi:hypothetical protein
MEKQMPRAISTFFMIILVCVGSSAFAADFYILPKECKILLVSLDDGSIRNAAGDPPTYGCIRRGEQIGCSVSYASGGKSEAGSTEIFQVLIDSPPLLYFGSDNGSTLFSVNTLTRNVGFTARLTDVGFIGEKVCSANYTTAQEVELYRNRKNKR